MAKILIIDGNPEGYFTQQVVDAAVNGLGHHDYAVIDYSCSRQYALQKLLEAEKVLVVSPIYWGRLPGRLEALLDDILIPGKVFKFMNIPVLTKRFGFKYSKGLTNIKEIHFALSYGSPRPAMMGVPYFRLAVMLSKMILNIKKVRHIPTYLCEGDECGAELRRSKTIRKVFKLCSTWQ